jgi:hypothetical protein
MSPSQLIDQYLAVRAHIAGRPSATGYQLERLRLNLPSGGNVNAQEEQRSFFSHLVYAVERLTPDERRVLFALRTPIPHGDKCPAPMTDAERAEHKFTSARCDCGAVRYYEREVRDGDLRIVERENLDGTKERVQETHAGERFLRMARDRDGEPVEGFVVVEGARAVYPTREQVAEQLGLGFSTVKRLISEAYRKLESALEGDADLQGTR